MARTRLPGHRSNIDLLLNSFWTIIGLFILIIGHLVMVLFAYGKYTETDALADLADYLPLLESNHLYIVAGLAVIADIWIVISHKKQLNHKIQR